MIAPSHSARIFMYKKAVDFRFGFERLAALAKACRGESAYGGEIYVFFNRSFTRAKVIFFDGSGCCMLWKRLEKGRFQPSLSNGTNSFVSLGSAEMMLLLEGAKIEGLKKPKPWEPGKARTKKTLQTSAGTPSMSAGI